ncbi:MAG: histidine kinase [Leptolyngbya sp. SIO1D8]|nr:histidine kinase [Leptolyngbya sp. SIO1D8]
MAFSRTQQWLTVGFGVVLTTLLGTALVARQAIVHRVSPLEWTEDENDEQAYFNELLIAIAEAEISQQAYFDTGEEAELDWYNEQLGIINSYLEELFEAYGYEEIEEDSPYTEALANLDIAIEEYILLLEDGIQQYQAGQLDLPIRVEMAQLSRENQLGIQWAFQVFLEEDNQAQQWEVADTSISINNDLWFTSVVVGSGCIAIGVLYGWLMQTLRRQAQITTDLQDQKETLSQNLHHQTAELHNAKATLRTELVRRQELEEICQEIEQAKELTDLKLNFFSLASHELRTPLSAILVSAQLLDNPNAEWSEAKRSRNLKRIQSAAKTMTQLLADILLLTRAEAGKLEFNPQIIDLQTFCQRLVKEVKFNTQAQHHISVLQQGDCNDACLDEKLLRALLMSLLTNAIKYSPQESEIQFIVWGENGHTRFQVQDQGIGISPGDQQHLFERHQLHAGGGAEGAGLLGSDGQLVGGLRLAGLGPVAVQSPGIRVEPGVIHPGQDLEGSGDVENLHVAIGDHQHPLGGVRSVGLGRFLAHAARLTPLRSWRKGQ